MSTIKFLQGDCLEWMNKISKKGKVVDVVLTSPPYNTSRPNKSDSSLKNLPHDLCHGRSSSLAPSQNLLYRKPQISPSTVFPCLSWVSDFRTIIMSPHGAHGSLVRRSYLNPANFTLHLLSSVLDPPLPTLPFLLPIFPIIPPLPAHSP